MSVAKFRLIHYAILAIAHMALTLPNLGSHSLWDMDEGVNAEAAREMIESENWITPFYNYELRTAKPALTYWLIAPSFLCFGVNEFAARLPSAICGLVTILLTYELGRRLFSPAAGLISGISLASCFEFCLISHAATPDPPLLMFTTLALVLYWFGSEGDRRWWFVPVGIATGFGMLTKGPVGLALPGLVIAVHLAWTGRLRILWDRWLLFGGLAFLLTAVPWYGMVALDSRGQWIKGFFGNENFKRFSEPAEGHSGWFFYHAALLFVLFAPWSAFLIGTFWNAIRLSRRSIERNDSDELDKYRFLLSWFFAFLVVFSISATKLPNYILPLYPALAIMTGRFLERWRIELCDWRKWYVIVCGAGIVLVGLVTGLGFLLAAGRLPIEVKGLRPMVALGDYAVIGIVPVITGILFVWLALRHRRDAAIAACGVGSVTFLGLIAALPTVAMNEYKCPQPLVQEARLYQPTREIRIGSYRWLRHSTVFYARREVRYLSSPSSVSEFLSLPRPTYLLVPEREWEALNVELTQPARILARRYDFLARCDVLVVANKYVD